METIDYGKISSGLKHDKLIIESENEKIEAAIRVKIAEKETDNLRVFSTKHMTLDKKMKEFIDAYRLMFKDGISIR